MVETATAAMLKKILNMKKILSRLTSLAEIAETPPLCGDFVQICKFMGLCYLNTLLCKL
jgi:hypothetical protein